MSNVGARCLYPNYFTDSEHGDLGYSFRLQKRVEEWLG